MEKDTAEPIYWITEATEFFQQTSTVQVATTENISDKKTATVTREFVAISSRKLASAQQVQVTESEQEEMLTLLISYPLDLNAANIEELETLPSIGSILAQRIVSYREMMGGFSNLEELMLVNGIGTGIYEQISPYLFIIGQTEPISSEPEISDMEECNTEFSTESIPMLDINTATAADFQQLPGITPTIAENIIRLRTQIQYFQNVYELLYADGMTDALFLSVRDYLYVNTI